jgi:AcrR family transcriptional regulator
MAERIPIMHRQPQIQERTKENLAEALFQLYETKPLYRISIRELTERAGYHRSTFYLYFRNIDELLHFAEDHLIQEILAYLNSLSSGSGREVYFAGDCEKPRKIFDAVHASFAVTRTI